MLREDWNVVSARPTVWGRMEGCARGLRCPVRLARAASRGRGAPHWTLNLRIHVGQLGGNSGM